MNERYFLPRSETIKRYSPKNWRDFLAQHWPGGTFINLKQDFAVTENPELGYRRFVQGEGGKVRFELLISDEAAELLKRAKHGGRTGIKQEITKEINKINQNPFGSDSINTRAQIGGGGHPRELSPINAFSSELESALGVPVALKGLGEKNARRENLTAQFRFMRQCAKEWEGLPPDVKEPLHVCKVYAAMRYVVPGEGAPKELLVMERVLNSKRTKTNRIGIEGAKGFSIAEHPILAGIIEKYLVGYSPKLKVVSNTGQECYEWITFAETMEVLELHLSDCNGNNLLYSETPSGEKTYTIIDQNAEHIYLAGRREKVKRDKEF